MDGLCIRRTFIDIARAPAARVRTASAPPGQECVDAHEDVLASGRYISELVAKAEEMRLCTKTSHIAQCEGDDTVTPFLIRTPESSPRAWSSSTHAAESISTYACYQEPSPSFHLPTEDAAKSDEVSSNADTSCPDETLEDRMSPCQSLQDSVSASPRSTGSISSNTDIHGYMSGIRGRFGHPIAFNNVVQARGYQPFVPAGTTRAWTPNLDWSSIQTTNPPAKSCQQTLSRCQQAITLEEGDTTLMISNLPFNLTSIDMLIEALDEYGFVGTYDLVYIPPKQKAMRVKSDTAFCFVNFKSPKHAASFVSKPDAFASNGSETATSVSRAKCQGFTDNLKAHLKSCGKVDNRAALRLFQ